MTLCFMWAPPVPVSLTPTSLASLPAVPCPPRLWKWYNSHLSQSKSATWGQLQLAAYLHSCFEYAAAFDFSNDAFLALTVAACTFDVCC